MALDFPTNPSVNQIYTYGGRSWQWNGTAWDVYSPAGGLTQYVSLLNGLCGSINLSAGTSISVTPSGNTLTIAYTGGGGGGSGATGATGATGPTGATGATGAIPTNYVISFNGITGSVTGVASFNGLTGTVTGVSTVNGATGTITNVAKTNITNSFSAGQNFTDPALTPSFNSVNYNNIKFFNDGQSTYQTWSPSFNTTDTTITFPNTSGTLALISGVVSSFNGLTGAVSGVTSSRTYTWSSLQSFASGISASGGVTFAGTLQGTTANFTGLVSSTVGFSGAGTNLTGNASGLTAGTASKVIVTATDSGSYYPMLASGAGNTGVFIDTTAPRWTYAPGTGTLSSTTGVLQSQTIQVVNSGALQTDTINSYTTDATINISSGPGGQVALKSNPNTSISGLGVVLDCDQIIKIGDVSGTGTGLFIEVNPAGNFVDFGGMGLASIGTIVNATMDSPLFQTAYFNQSTNSTDIVKKFVTNLTTTSTTANQVIISLAKASYRSATFFIQGSDSTNTKYQALTINAIYNGLTAYNTQYGNVVTSSSVGTFNVDIGGVGNNFMRLLVTPSVATSTKFTVEVTAIPV